MTSLPEEFIRYTRQLIGDERFQSYLESFQEDVPVSIRLNPRKMQGWTVVDGAEPVPWCHEGYYLKHRPQFTMDPLLHAGCYYVQEAASMFVSHVLRQYVSQPVAMLDLCAAPGGKSTAAIAALPEGSVLTANEPIRQRASILSENIQKWGYPACTVTNQYPEFFRKSKHRFDVILCDVPCSGEGMFRRDAATIAEWSPKNVEHCCRLQRDIVSNAWECLNPGGLLIYSTCTFNTHENEENVSWIQEQFGAEVLPVDTRSEWHITGSLLPGFNAPVYRFIPGITRSEGLFMCVLRKRGGTGVRFSEVPPNFRTSEKKHLETNEPPRTDLSYPQAIAYLRGEALVLPPDTPRGIVNVTFMGHVLGQAKNIGTRANNLYPKQWRIKTTHIPNDPPEIVKIVK
jgi:16S rRNA C967 or C1407 C5-methylase (RsmB/RsmF family)